MPRNIETWEEGPYGIVPAEPGPRRRQDRPQSQDDRLLDRHHALLPADKLHRLRATVRAAGGGGVHPPWLPFLASFTRWAGVGKTEASDAFAELAGNLAGGSIPVGDDSILAH